MGDIRKAIAEIFDTLPSDRTYGFSEAVNIVVSIAFAAYTVRLKNIGAKEALASVLDRARGTEIERFLKKNAVACEKLSESLSAFDVSELKRLILYTEDQLASRTSQNLATPPSLLGLAVRLLDIKPGDSVADIGTGTGTFLCEAFRAEPAASFCGIDVDREAASVASMRAAVMGENVSSVRQNIFQADEFHGRCDKIFANFPFGVRLRGSEGAEGYLKKRGGAAQFSKLASSDWVFAMAVIDCLKAGGEAVCVMSNGSMYNTADRPVREELVRQGLVKAVVMLPEKLFDYTAIPVSLVVLKRGCSGVILADARELCRRERRQNVIAESDAEKIAALLAKKQPVSVGELADNNFVFDPAKYTPGEEGTEDTWTFEEISSSLRRGAQLTASQLDGMVSAEPSDIRYLMLSNIQDGVIEAENLPYLSKLESKYDKFCLKDGSLVISKNGMPFKSAVPSVGNGARILANGNLFIVDLDTEKVSPYYVKAFLDSPAGEAALAAIAQNGNISSISLEALKKLRIPAADMKRQHGVARKYEAALAGIVRMKEELKNRSESLKQIFDSQD